MKDYDKNEAQETLDLILNDCYSTSRPSHLIIEELVLVIRLLSEKIQNYDL